ncbi:MAG: hypothetical protein LBL31_00685, partial [Spirochaetaceae bacterium]|nr:hypothetical protein [Spirochaetaceae bacterium]
MLRKTPEANRNTSRKKTTHNTTGHVSWSGRKIATDSLFQTLSFPFLSPFLQKTLFFTFFTIFCPQNKAKPVLNTLIESMRDLRILAPDACYSVRTGV